MSEKQQVKVGLVRDELLTTNNAAIEFWVPAETDPEYVMRAVGVFGVDGKVEPAGEAGHYVWSPAGRMRAGRYVLTIEGLADKYSQLLSEDVELPFTVVATAAKIPAGLQIESFVRVRLGADGSERLPTDGRPEGDYIDFVKATDRKSEKPVALAYDQDGREVDGEAQIAEQQKGLMERMGKMHPVLIEAVKAGAEADESLLVDVWYVFEEDEPDERDRPQNGEDVDRAARRAERERQKMVEQNKEFAASLQDYGEVANVDQLAPLVTLWMPAAAVPELAQREDVGGLFLHETEGIEDLDDSIDIAGSDVVHAAGENGSGIDVAVWESGPTSNSNLVIAGAFQSNPSTSNHSQNVHAIIRNNESGSPNGHAPGCNLHSANSTNRSALTWAVGDEACTVVNQSFHRSSEPGSGALSSDDLYGDWLALHWPYPLIVHAAGNFWNGDADNIQPPSSEFVNHKGYNTISVGNHNDSATAMRSSSVFRNPNSSHGDRELPEIAANGTSVTADGIMMTGTSQASPAVAGIAALLQGTGTNRLEHWPEGSRAVLAATADRNVRDGTWWQDVSAGVDARDGAGAVNAAEAHRVAQNKRSPNALATRRGWDTGLLTSSDFNNNRLSTFEYKVSVPNTFFGPRKVKVALAWTSKVSRFLGVVYGSNLAVDLDLKVYDSSGNQVAYSGSWDNSYEIAEFTGQRGQTYTIKIRRWSGTENTWYGIAWTVTGGFFFRFPFERILERVSRRG